MLGILRRKSTNFIINGVNLPIIFARMGHKIVCKRTGFDK